jgi:hypothetical protein
MSDKMGLLQVDHAQFGDAKFDRLCRVEGSRGGSIVDNIVVKARKT